MFCNLNHCYDSQIFISYFCSENKFIFSLSVSEKLFILKRKSRKKSWRKQNRSFCLHIQTCLKNYRSPMSLLSTPAQDSVLRDSYEPTSALCSCRFLKPPQLFLCTFLSDRLRNCKPHFAQLDSHRTLITYSRMYTPLIYSLF